jgi:putative Ca2+/H+ antiporter (TMEM165/GDT1 family)
LQTGQEELDEVQQELKQKESELEAEKMGSGKAADLEGGGTVKNRVQRSKIYRVFAKLCSPILIQAFTMTFLAEWGDRSQLTTIILGSREDPIGVSIGGTIGHALCTAMAVIGGKLIAQKISVRTVTIIGGVLFLLFAISALFIDENGGWSLLITACTDKAKHT